MFISKPSLKLLFLGTYSISSRSEFHLKYYLHTKEVFNIVNFFFLVTFVNITYIKLKIVDNTELVVMYIT